MSNYAKATNFASKDTLPTGNALKIVRGTELDNEFNAIATAVNSKADSASPVLTGTPTAPNAALGTRGTQIATMESFDTEFAKSHGTSGYQKLPGGFILQWGNVSVTATNVDHAFVLPLAFPTKALAVSITPNNTGVGASVSVQDAWPKAAASTIVFRSGVTGNHIIMAWGY